MGFLSNKDWEGPRYWFDECKAILSFKVEVG